MMTPMEAVTAWKKKIKKEWELAFLAAFFLGLLTHLPVMLSDIPNHDGLSSMYFDQNMITSGRWFLSVACGASSYYTLPWLIGLLGLVYLSLAAAALTEFLELKSKPVIVLVSGLLAVFPALASTFAYVFTLDGYMLALLLAVLAVLLTKKYRLGFLGGALCMAFSLGIYQAYMAFAIILCIYAIVILFIEERSWKTRVRVSCRYLCMGVLGVALYFCILQVLLQVQGKELADYQGIGGMGSAAAAQGGLLETLAAMYKDFAVFTLRGNILFNNIFSGAGMLLLGILTAIVVLTLFFQRKWWKKPGFFVIMGLLAAGLPFAANIILLISPDVTYHLLMRYQWALCPILTAAFVSRYGKAVRSSALLEWGVVLSVFVLVFNYVVMDQIGYSNLQKRYEKTYAYCLRLLDRIEQTEGYYQGIPIAIVGVVGYDEFPATDITEPVTGGMIGLSGDTLLYTADNYQAFMKNYLGATLNFLDVETVGEIYLYDEEYIAMDTFPGPNSVKVVDGILYVKTENTGRD